MAQHKDFAVGEVLTAPSPDTTGTSLVLKSGQGGDMPATPFYATAIPPVNTPTKSTSEVVLVTTVSADTLTIVRGQKGTTAKSIAAGWVIVNTLYVSEALKVGDIFMSLRATPETGRVFMDGGTYTKANYPLMYEFVKNNAGYGTYTTTSGSESFTLKDMRTRVPVGKNASGTFATLGATGGEETHVLTIAEMPSHTHGNNGVLGWGAGPTNSGFARTDTNSAANPWGVVNATGGGGAHNNLQPYIVVNYEVVVG